MNREIIAAFQSSRREATHTARSAIASPAMRVTRAMAGLISVGLLHDELSAYQISVPLRSEGHPCLKRSSALDARGIKNRLRPGSSSRTVLEVIA